jgi:hypothetical protein
VDFFRDLFASNNLFDVQPSCLVPTWRNGRSGTAAIARRLDRFLVAEAFMISPSPPSSWVEFPFVSDHAPILLNLMPPTRLRPTPFKFNHHWIQSGDYSNLVREVWTDPSFLLEENPQRRIVWKLKTLKSKSKRWFKALKSFTIGPSPSAGIGDPFLYRFCIHYSLDGGGDCRPCCSRNKQS